MWFLRAGSRPLVFALALLVATLSAMPSAAHPPDGPAHGVDETTFHTLWSGDADDADAADLEARPTGSAEEMRTLAAATDIPLDAPPEAVERWNRGDHREFPATDAEASIHPESAVLRDGTFVKDAYAAVFAVQPSTRALVTPTEQPLFVATEGTLLGTVDYRLETPRASIGPNRSVEWSLENHGIDKVRLVVDGELLAARPGTHTPTLQYEFEDAGLPRTLTLEADITATVSRRISTCGDWDPNNSTCGRWDGSTDRRTETITVSESIEVEPYELSLTGAWGRYPDGALGLALYRNQPWSGYAVPGGDVRGVWRFYSARDERWDRLVASAVDGDARFHSPMHPLQVYAYPFEPGPTASPRDAVTILETYGLQVTPPSLPPTVNLDVIDEPYTASYGLVTRTETSGGRDWTVRATGLVRGSATAVTAADLREVPIHESELELEVLESNEEHVTVQVRLTDAVTGEPIATKGRRGYVLLDGERVETNASGIANRTMPRPAGGLAARFVPGPWWPEPVGYVGDSDVVYVRGTVLQALHVLYEVGVPTALFLFGVFVIDRITGWRMWPPWRRL